jgi:peptidoglycan/LPS O-acetylase OafA/YrhL
MISVAWSLSYEMAYYVVLPWLVSVCVLRERTRAQRVAGFTAVAAAITLTAWMTDGPVRLLMFVAGILLHEALHVGARISPPSNGLACTALILSVIATPIFITGSVSAYVAQTLLLFVVFGSLCWSCFARPEEWLARGFAWTPLRWLGNMSYSYYLLHGLTLKAAVLALSVIPIYAAGGPLLFWSALPLLFGATLVPSTLLFLAVERRYSIRQSSSEIPSAASAQMERQTPHAPL